MFKGRISRVFDLEPEEKGSSANARGSSGQLCLPTLDERVTLYLRAVYGKSDFTRQEYSEARKLILNAMAADFAAKSGVPGGGSHELGRGPKAYEPLITTPLQTLREDPQNCADGLSLISFPDRSIGTPWAV